MRSAQDCLYLLSALCLLFVIIEAAVYGRELDSIDRRKQRGDMLSALARRWRS